MIQLITGFKAFHSAISKMIIGIQEKNSLERGFMFVMVFNFRALHGYIKNHSLKYDYLNNHICASHTCHM